MYLLPPVNTQQVLLTESVTLCTCIALDISNFLKRIENWSCALIASICCHMVSPCEQISTFTCLNSNCWPRSKKLRRKVCSHLCHPKRANLGISGEGAIQECLQLVCRLFPGLHQTKATTCRGDWLCGGKM